MNPISYNSSNRDRFEPPVQRVLDALTAQYEIVEVERTNVQDGNESSWFVQVSKSHDELPVGFFGATIESAATRLASALKVEF